jgi:purine-binding chemotaxis protein CheW
MKTATISDQFVLFRLDNEQYGVDVFQVMEVIQFGKTTKVPDMPDYVVGVINLRGQVVPVIDLKQRLKLGRTEMGKATRIIIMNYKHEAFEGLLGVLADEVSDVEQISPDQIQPAPEVGTNIKSEYVHGMASLDTVSNDTEEHDEQRDFIMLLDLNRMMEDSGLSLIDQQKDVTEFNQDEQTEDEDEQE